MRHLLRSRAMIVFGGLCLVALVSANLVGAG